MKALRVFARLFVVTTAAYAQQAVVLFSNPTFTPANNTCTPSSTFTQTATYRWEVDCVTGTAHTAIKSGTVSGQGTGACDYLSTFCKVNGTDNAPQFSPASQTAVGNFQIWVNISSIGLVNNTQGSSICGTQSNTQGTIATTTVLTAARLVVDVPTPVAFVATATAPVE
jgi:hypothetical protein